LRACDRPRADGAGVVLSISGELAPLFRDSEAAAGRREDRTMDENLRARRGGAGHHATCHPRRYGALCHGVLGRMRAGVSRINPNPFTTRAEIEGTFGVVTSTHWIATAVGMATLEKGGNAFDAAVATAFVLQVVEPHLKGPGGDVPVIVHDVKRGATQVICGQGPAPAKATIAHYKSEGLEMVPGTGLLAACGPGTFESWMMLLRDYGTMRLRDVLEPAISYASNGYPLVERACATIQTVEQLFRKYWNTSAEVYLPNGEVPR